MAADPRTASAVDVLKTACPLDCPDACSLDVDVEDGRVVRIGGNRDNPTTAGFICSKVRDFGRHVYHDKRVLHPLMRDGEKGAGRFRRASWDEALSLVVERMRAARERHGGEAILPFSYGGSNGALTQDSTDARFFRRLGASRLLRTVCAVPTGLAAQGMYGKMAGVGFEDYEAASLIVIWGANPSASHIHLVPFVKRAQSAGTKLVVVDPRRTKLAKAADLHLAPRPGTDLPLALSVLRWFFAEGRAARGFLEQHAAESDELERRAAAWTLERAAAECGLEAREIEAFARLYADSEPAVLRCGWGLERNAHGGSAVCAVLALPAVAGKFGVRGGGYTLSNAASWRLAPTVDDPPAPTRAINMNRLGRVLEREEDPPLDPPVEVLFVYNSNVLATNPDQERVRRGLSREDVFTVVYEQVLTDTALYADVVLPATTFLEHHELARGYGTYAIHAIEPVIAPVGEARPNYAVFAELARRMDLARPGDEEDPSALQERALRARADLREGLAEKRMAFAPWGAGRGPVQFLDVLPGTPDQRVHLVPDELERIAPSGLYGYAAREPDARFPLALISPSTQRTISSTLGQLHEGLVPLELDPADAAARGISDGDPVRVFNDLGEVLTMARLSDDLRPGLALLPKGLWSHNTRNGQTANALAPDTLSDLGGGACFNDARVEVERAGA